MFMIVFSTPTYKFTTILAKDVTRPNAWTVTTIRHFATKTFYLILVGLIN